MTRDEIDAVQAEWFGKLVEATNVIGQERADALAKDGLSPDEIKAALGREMEFLHDWLMDRHRDIRAIIVSGKYGEVPVLADGTEVRIERRGK